MWLRLFLCLLISSAAVAQSAAPAPVVDDEFVHRQFGDSCNPESKWAPAIGDLNGDGVQDIVIVAHCKNPLIDQGDKNYQVIDPLDAFYGYGNPKITAGGFAQDDPKLRGIVLLVIHGSGDDGWRSATPQGKFVIINLAVKSVAVKKMRIKKKKKSVVAIYVEEAGGDQMTAAIFWDGRKYRYEPLGSSME